MSVKEVRIIEWVDSTGGGGWQSLRDWENEKPHRIQTVGWVLRENLSEVAIVQSIDELDRTEPFGDHLIVIPRFAIYSERTLLNAGDEK